MRQEKILVIGALGQIGVELTDGLRTIYGANNVIATDIKDPNYDFKNAGHYEFLDVLDKNQLIKLIRSQKITQIYHLAALLSATSENNPQLAWKLNIDGLLNVLYTVKDNNIQKLFWPSSIAVFGPNTPKLSTPQFTVMDPDTVYGISKLAGEGWCAYFHAKYKKDIRSLRYPGLIGYKSLPGGGTTDYAIHIFFEAIKNGSYNCFLNQNTELPMMYMADAVKATIELMNAQEKDIKIRSSYNITAMSFTPADLSNEIKKYISNFSCTYKSDFRQAIADSWPKNIDDSFAKMHWNWKPDFDIISMTKDMIVNVRKKLSEKLEVK